MTAYAVDPDHRLLCGFLNGYNSPESNDGV
jgi:hypothetical protein